MRHDASEGHRLLHQVYERDGSLGPIQQLSSFSQAHRGGWSRLREQLPVQLMDVGDEVNSVFDAIDQEVGPLRALLPTKKEQQGQTGHAPQRADGVTPGDRPASTSATPSGSRTGETTTHPHPSSSSSAHDQSGGLVGGAGDLLDPPLGGATPARPRATAAGRSVPAGHQPPACCRTCCRARGLRSKPGSNTDRAACRRVLDVSRT
ncbi:hypothetical protein SANTM175S_01597 [Streptomyces antimycoticus]